MPTSTAPAQRHLPLRGRQSQVLDILRVRGAASRAQLVSATGLSRATISEITGELIRSGHIVPSKASTSTKRVGRTPEALALNPDSGTFVGIEFSHDAVTVVASDAAHRITGSATRSHARETAWESRLTIAVELIDSLDANRPVNSPLLAIGAGVPGTIAQRSSVLGAIESHLVERYGVPVRLENNARLAGLAEFYWGAAQSMHDLAYMRLSGGVGGLLIIDNQVRDGNSATAGEFGHVCIDPLGPECRCSNRGCLEAYVGLEKVLTLAGASSIDDLVRALDRAEPRAQAVIADAGARVGLVLANACNILDLSSVVLGGALSRTGDYLVRAVRQSMARHLHGDAIERLQIRTASLGAIDGALGGIALVLQDLGIPLSDTVGATLERRTVSRTA
ncbi:ROK family protein [Microbacterium sp. A94]|uniref:ROK family protein n=1 Tax=Microbacterium sp. A94 TaxID=3450717 RepID=UPI003F421745